MIIGGDRPISCADGRTGGEPAYRILCVGDNPLDHASVCHALERERAGFVIVRAVSRQEFEARLATESFDAVLADASHVDGPGLDAVSLVRERQPEIPVIILTGSEHLALEAMQRGATAHVLKTPLHMRRLVFTLQAVLEKVRFEKDRRLWQKTLEESEARYRSLFENNHAVMLLIDPESGAIVDANPAACAFYGYPRDQLQRMEIGQLNGLPPERVHAALRQARTCECNHFSFEHRLASGETRLVEAYSGPISIDGKQLLYSIVHDISERKQAERQLRELNRTMRVLSRCNEMLVRAQNEHELLHKICSLLVEQGGYPFAWVAYAGAGDTLEIAATSGQEPIGYVDRHRHLPTREREQCPVVEVLATGRMVLLKSLRQTPDFAHFEEVVASHGIAAAISLPLLDGEVTLGVLTIYSQEENDFDDEEIRLLMELANDLAYGIAALRTATARRAAEETLRLRNRAIEASSNGIIICELRNGERLIQYVNPAFERITGYSFAEVRGHTPRFLAGEDQEQKGLIDLREALRQGREVDVEVRNYRKDGTLFWSEVAVAPLLNAAGEVTHTVSVINDITDRRHYEMQLEHQANHDFLTGLANRNLLVDRLQHGMAQAARARQQLAVMLLDLDRFKVINDSLGHSQGDALLQSVGKRLAAAVRAADTVARLGGDEFVIALGQIDDVEEIATVANKIIETCNEPHQLFGREITVSASIGISTYPHDGEDSDTLLRNADIAMYRAKEDGGGAFRFYAAEMNAKVMETLELEADLRRALERGELLLYYQPKVDLTNGMIAGGEALLRWQHPRRGLVLPATFMDLAEETGLILPIGRWVLSTACRQARAWQAVAGAVPIPVSVNLSAVQFQKEDVVGLVRQALAEAELAPALLELELTESMLMRDPERTVVTMQQLKALGVRLSLDDFGTGYSSLNYLRRFPFDSLKIDRSFISDVSVDQSATAVANSIVAIAHSLQLSAIAEGVETLEQLDFLGNCACDAFQGFLFSQPLALDEFTALLRDGRRLER